MSYQRYARGMSNGGSTGVLNANGLQPVSEDQLRRNVPSIYAEAAHESRSDRYGYVPTYKVLGALQEFGFQPFFAQQQRCRKADRQDFTKHMIRLRHRDHAAKDAGEAHDLILLNGHDGSGAWCLMHGIFRFMCCNGLFTGETFGSYKVMHRANAIDRVVEASATALKQGQEIMGVIDEWKSIQLSYDQQNAYAKAALVARFKGDLDKCPIEPVEAHQPRRVEDQGNSLWLTYNRTQENLVRGGQNGVVTGKNGRRRNKTVRSVNAIDGNRVLNQALFTLAEEMAKLAK